MNKKFNEAISQEEILDQAKEAAYYDSWLEAQIETSVNRGKTDGLVEDRLEGIKHMISVHCGRYPKPILDNFIEVVK